MFDNVQVEIYGESHSKSIGVRIDGFPRGVKIDLDVLEEFMQRRSASSNPWSTPRKEEDKPIFVSGLENGVLNGDIIEAVIENNNVRSVDYNETAYVPRPSHADYVAYVKDEAECIPSGGGRFSGRMTAPLCIAGGIAKQILSSVGVEIASYVSQIGLVKGKSYKTDKIELDDIKAIKTPLKSLSNADEMTAEVMSAAKEGDSVGGVVDVIIWGMPVGVGNNLFDGLEGKIAYSVFGVPAVKGIEFGKGFELSSMRGSEANDNFDILNDQICTKTNNSGGINGGISNGAPITMSVAFRPTPSISKEQDSVNLQTGEKIKLKIKGRHDACIVPRGAVAIEASVALAILDAMLEA